MSLLQNVSMLGDRHHHKVCDWAKRGHSDVCRLNEPEKRLIFYRLLLPVILETVVFRMVWFV